MGTRFLIVWFSRSTKTSFGSMQMDALVNERDVITHQKEESWALIISSFSDYCLRNGRTSIALRILGDNSSIPNNGKRNRNIMRLSRRGKNQERRYSLDFESAETRNGTKWC